jgi:acylglycerol lipase
MTSLWVKGPSNTEFFVNIYNADNPKACLLFCHGFIEHIGRYSDIFPTYAQRGISVACFDQRGFGKTACDKEHNNVCSYKLCIKNL